MRLKRLTLVLLALAAFPLSGHSEDLLDAYRQARANDPTLAQADATRLATREDVPQALAALLPQVTGTWSIQQANGGNAGSSSGVASTNALLSQLGLPPITGTNTGHVRTASLQGTVNQTVFDFSKISTLRGAHSTVDAQEATYQAAVQDLYVRVATAYFQVLTDQDLLKFDQANQEALRQSYDQANEQFKVGLTAITNVYQAKAAFDNAVAVSIAQQNTVNNDREQLRQITGQPVGELKTLRDDLPLDPPQPNNEEQWVDEALRINPTIIAQQYSVDAAEHSINTARAGHLPTLTASGSIGNTRSWSQTPGSDSRVPGGNTVGLSLNIPIFSGGLVQSQVRQSIYQRDEAQDSLEAQRRSVRTNTLNAFRSIVSGIAQVQSAKSGVESGQKSLDATRAGFQVGTQTMIDVLNAIQQLTQNQSTYSQVRHQFVLNKLLLKQDAGTVTEKDMEAVNSLLQ